MAPQAVDSSVAAQAMDEIRTQNPAAFTVLRERGSVNRNIGVGMAARALVAF
jgi:hypothetical protein